jgi:hypothetical protein
MAGVAQKADPKLWDNVKRKVTRGNKGGKPGQWSARKAQLAVQQYKAQGGRYVGRKSEDNHLRQWTKEDWGTKSGHQSLENGERYLPRKARESLSSQEYDRTSRKKRDDLRRGKQFSRQPRDIAKAVAPARRHGSAARPNAHKLEALTRSELLGKARRHKVTGASKMRKADLVKALEQGTPR